jgi:hypothetical protein
MPENTNGKGIAELKATRVCEGCLETPVSPGDDFCESCRKKGEEVIARIQARNEILIWETR